MLNIEVTIVSPDEPHILAIVQAAARAMGLEVKRNYQCVIVTLSETHELHDLAVAVHTAALQAE